MHVEMFKESAARARVEQAVKDAESRTVAEIVPVIASRSGRYQRAEDSIGMLCGFVALIVLGLIDPEGHPWWPANLVALFLGVAFGAGVLARLPAVVRFFAGRQEMQRQVENQAFRHFRTFGVGVTTSRHGVLIYVSLFERRVVVLEDPAITATLPAQSAAMVRDAIIARMRDGKPVDAVIEGITVAGNMLAAAFPRRADDVNELPDTLRLIES